MVHFNRRPLPYGGGLTVRGPGADFGLAPSCNLLLPGVRPVVRPSWPGVGLAPPRARRCQGSYLVDSASSHMLVSKIKPCMSKYKQLYCETANGSLNQLSFI
jgi:hypothetical protein